MTAYRIILADDHVLVRQGLKRILDGEGDLEVIGEAADGLELLDHLKRSSPNLIILDISMPRLRGIEAIHEIRAVMPNVGILVLTMHKDREYVYLALSAGAGGYLLKEDADNDLFHAIDRIRHGKTYVSPHLADDMLAYLVQDTRDDGSQPHDIDRLTTREREVVKLIAEGRSSKEIADLLCISVRTVDNHRARIMEKLNLKKATDLVKYALQKGYV